VIKALLVAAALCLTAGHAVGAATDIAAAAQQRDWARVITLAKQRGTALDAVSAEGSSALHFAIDAGEIPVVQALLDAGIDVSRRNVAGVSPLQLAVSRGDTTAVKLLLAKGADAKAFDEAKESMLMLAARSGDGEMARALIAKGVAPDYVEPRYGQDALMLAVRFGNTSVVKALIESGAELNHQTPPGPPPVTREPGAGGGSTGEGMVRSGVPPEGQRLAGTGRMSALLYAARDGRLDAAQLLVKAGAKLEVSEYNNITPLLMAISNDHHPLAKLLIEAGANVNAADWYGRRPLWAAVESRNRDVTSTTATTNGVDREAALQVITLLLAKGAQVDAPLLHFPPRMGGHAFNMSYVPTIGETALYRASYNNDVAVMRLLLARGADPKRSTDNGTSPLMAAAGVGWVRSQTFTPGGVPAQLEAVKMLVELGGDVNQTNDMGLVAVHGAAFRWSGDVIVYLVEHGARLDIKDKIGRDAYTWAKGVTIPSTPPEPSPGTMAVIEKLVAQGKGVARANR